MTAYTLPGDYGAFALTGVDVAPSYGRALVTNGVDDFWGGFSLIRGLAGEVTSATAAEKVFLSDIPNLSLGTDISEGFLTGDAASRSIVYGPSVSDALQFGDLTAFKAIYSRLISEGASVSAALYLALAASCSETLTLSQTTQLALAITVMQTLFAGDAATTTLKFSVSVAEAMLSNAAFGSFLGVSVAELSGVADALTPLLSFGATISEGTTLGELASGSLLVSVALADGATFDDNNLLQYIFNGVIAEGVDITAGYVAPSGTFTSWAINTRTTGVTEYQDFAFDSLIQSGRKSLGANATGLYELDGDTDAGAPIVADILSGYMQLGGSHFKAFKAAYLGVATPGGQFVLKLITGDGATYAYTVTARTMHTARVNFGKGLRNRYFRFELQNIDGADFNLDNVEFIPLVSQRRV